MTAIFVVGLSKWAWTGLLTVTPVLLVAVPLLWLYATARSRR